jgi:hypothetical protein
MIIPPSTYRIIDIDAVSEGLRTLVGMFKALNQPIFPRNIMTQSYSGFFSVNNLQQLFSAYQRADYYALHYTCR